MERNSKELTVKGKVIDGQSPAICLPLIGTNEEELIRELKTIVAQEPDLIEWRGDFFEKLDEEAKVMDALLKIKDLAGEIPILFTIRSVTEGGEPIPLNEEAKVHLLTRLIETGKIELVDYELHNESRYIEHLREVTRSHDVKLMVSYHNFEQTPPLESLFEKGEQAEQYEADLVKFAVMPDDMKDVLVVLEATHSLDSYLRIPVVAISMGGNGSISRMFGWRFGSMITFAVGHQSSAPGQIPLEDLRTVVGIIKKSL
ncbi:type I 3-dehydroquinate dehydratase [Halobacillus naozhouensis]|uniref:3-dehydroquinate dehydratase n=1 Tax=Halobacillus naozhouensis TaxID=554880 RepID=A0ABY8J3C5_9BACI|nr:type I 3-dehydroquinate dehydratase [Halobacillus naozhouensis]WFT75366.1 type I 3-dehydroquinate dehydratase [Halobacillus naozhouensis]